MEITLLGIVIAVRLLQPAKALPPMLVTLFGRGNEVRHTHPENAELPIEVIPLPEMDTVFSSLQFLNILSVDNQKITY